MTKTRSLGSTALVAFTFSLLAATAWGAPQPLRCSIVGDDFEPRAVRITKIDDAGIEFVDNTTNASATLPFDRLVRLESFPGPDVKPKAGPSTYLLVLHDGQRWIGSPGAMEGDDLQWLPDALFSNSADPSKPVKVPVKSIVAIASLKSVPVAQAERSAIGGTALQDELRLTNGDVVAGVVSASDGKTITVSGAGGTPTTVDWTHVRLAKFAAVGGAASDAPPARSPFRLTLRDGRVIDGAKLTSDGNGLTFQTVAGGALSLGDGQNIVVIEHIGGSIHLLANLLPVSQQQAPYFPTATARAPFEVHPEAVAFSGRVFRASIPARPRSTITWSLDGSAKTFVTRLGIRSGRPLADVTARVKLDGAVVHEQAHIKSGEPGSLLKIPLGAAKTLTLEVDYGDSYDVQDEFYWLDPALLSE